MLFRSKDNPDDIYQFLFPLKIVLDEDQFGNSHYEVVVKNTNTNQFFSYLMSPDSTQLARQA